MSDEHITPETETDFAETQTREQIRPPATFKGKELLPYSRGTRILYYMVLDDKDLIVYRALSFVYIHQNPRKEMCKLVWGDVNEFRDKILEFRDSLSDDDLVEAQKIWEEAIKSDGATKVIPEPDDDGKKKDGEA